MLTQMQQIFSVEGKSGVVITSEQEEHLKFIGKPLPGLTEIAGQIRKDHAYLLENYGAWMDALVKNEIQPLTEAQRKFIKVAKGKLPGDTCFENAWINSLIVKNSNRTDLITRETQLSERISNVRSFPNSESINNEKSNLGGGFGFLTGIVLAVLAFSIVPVIPVIIAFIAGHWLSYTFGNHDK